MKMISRVLMAAVAVAALAAPAMAANDKLIVQDAGANTVFKVDDTGVVMATKIGVGTSTPFTSLHVPESSVSPVRGIASSQHNDGAQGGFIQFYKSRGTMAAPTQPAAGDYIGVFAGQFWDGTQYIRSAQFGFRNDLPVSTGLFPTAIMFYTGNTGANLLEGLRVSSLQSVVAGNGGGAATGSLPLTATDGFLYIPTTAGLVTSCATATQYVGHVPIWYDTTNNKLCTCNGTTRKCAPSAFN